MIEGIRNETEQCLKKALTSLSELETELQSSREEATSLLTEKEAVFTHISALRASRNQIKNNCKQMESLVEGHHFIDCCHHQLGCVLSVHSAYETNNK